MKLLLLLLVCSISVIAGAQKFSLITRANMNTAAGEQVHKFKNAYGMGIGFEMAVKKTSPVKWVVNADAGINSIKSMPYEFEFNNVLTKTTIEYVSNINEVTSGLRYVFNESRKLKPYAGMSIGMLRYSTNYTIADPEEEDGCHAIESEKIQSDKSFIGKIEGGLRFASRWKVCSDRNILFDVGLSYKRGTAAEYMRLGNAHIEEGTDYSVKFQSSTNEVHEHAIGKIYKTPVNQVGFHLGLVIPFSRD